MAFVVGNVHAGQGNSMMEVVTENSKKSANQRSTDTELIGKRSINYKRNGAAKVTEKVFKIVVEVDPIYESEVPKKNGIDESYQSSTNSTKGTTNISLI